MSHYSTCSAHTAPGMKQVFRKHIVQEWICLLHMEPASVSWVWVPSWRCFKSSILTLCLPGFFPRLEPVVPERVSLLLFSLQLLLVVIFWEWNGHRMTLGALFQTSETKLSPRSSPADSFLMVKFPLTSWLATCHSKGYWWENRKSI